VDMMSQPSRACCYFAHLARLPVTRRRVNLGKKEQRATTYPNPLKQVPCLVERDGFVLPESSAILKYLADRHTVADHWYPRELRARARVNAALDWHHFSLRRGAAGVTWFSLIARNMGMKTDPGMARAMLGVLKGALGTLESTWLTDDAPFMMGSSRPCVADLLVAEEIFNLTLLEAIDEDFGMPPTLDALLGEGHPRVTKFLAACQDLDFDEWRSIHGVLHTARDKMAARKKARSRM